jgi:hypothetical protein
MHDLRMDFNRDQTGTWFLRVSNTRTSCEETEVVGSFDVLSDERVRALASAVTSLIERSSCGVLPVEGQVSTHRRQQRLEPWVRPAGGVYAAASGLAFTALWLSDDPQLPATLGHAPSVAMASGLAGGFAGGMATLFVPERAARPLLELTIASSTALLALSMGLVPERGVPAFGEYAVAGGYGISALLIGVDWAFSAPAALLGAPAGAAASDAPAARASPWLIYAPATVGALLSVSRALSPSMRGDDREMTLSLGAYALAPALTGLVLGVVGSQRSEDHEPPEPWIAGGPNGSFGLTVGGAL